MLIAQLNIFQSMLQNNRKAHIIQVTSSMVKVSMTHIENIISCEIARNIFNLYVLLHNQTVDEKKEPHAT